MINENRCPHIYLDTAASTPVADEVIAALAEQIKDLKETVNILISQIQMLRSEVKDTKSLSRSYVLFTNGAETSHYPSLLCLDITPKS